MSYYPKIVEQLIGRLKRFPGIGQKSAERIAGWLMEEPQEDVLALAENLRVLKESVRLCPVCFNLTETDLCDICRETGRRRTICVVEEVRDLIVMEKTGYHGFYHVLGGRISITEHLRADDLRIPQLIQRLQEGSFEEVIIATNPTPEGEDTAVHLSSLLKQSGIPHSRLAYGLPVGAEIEYVDTATLKKSMEGRKTLS